jgi:hypothetical protein
MNPKTAGDRLRYAKRYASVLTSGGLPPNLLQLRPDKRVHIMKALSCLAKFTGKYDEWLQLRRRYNLTWSTGNESLAAFERFFDNKKTLETMLQWVIQARSMLPSNMSDVIKFNCITGLRPNECIAAIRLIKSDLASYYSLERTCLEHFRHPEIFLRRTKSAYVSILDKELLQIALKISKIPSYEAIRYAVVRKGLEFHMGYCRKIFASYLRQAGIESEIVDLIQGHVPRSVFVRHYLTPDSSLRNRVLSVIHSLEQQIP